MLIKTDISGMLPHHAAPSKSNQWLVGLMLAGALVILFAAGAYVLLKPGQPNAEISRILDESEIHVQLKAAGLAKLERGGFMKENYVRVTALNGEVTTTGDMPSTDQAYELELKNNQLEYKGKGPVPGQSFDDFMGAMLADIKQAAAVRQDRRHTSHFASWGK